MKRILARFLDEPTSRPNRQTVARIGSVLFWLVLTNGVQAACRIGSGPDFGDGIPYCSELEEEAPPVESGPIWLSRWGAIAIDPKVTTGGIGFARRMDSRQAAEKAALRECRSNGGGSTCRVELAYDNQCGVLAWGDEHYNTANSESLEDAQQLALSACAEYTKHCKVFYSDCEVPVRVR